MSDQSFEAIEAMLATDESRVSALTHENNRLKEMLNSMRKTLPLPSVPVDESTILAQLEISLANQLKLEKELNALREDQSGELTVLRTSLAILASELELEKARTTPATQTKEEAIAAIKATALKSQPDELRRALARMKSESGRRNSNDSTATRRTSLGGTSLAPKETAMRRGASLGGTSPKISSIGEEGEPIGLGLAVSRSPRAKMERTVSDGAYPTVSSRENWEEDEKSAKLRYARLGITTTRIGGLVSPVPGPSVDSLLDVFEPERRRMPSISTTSPLLEGEEEVISPSGISDEIDEQSLRSNRLGGEDIDSPLITSPELPPAPLKMSNRQESFPVFDAPPPLSSVSPAELSARFSSYSTVSSPNQSPTFTALSLPNAKTNLPALPSPTPFFSSSDMRLLTEIEILKNQLAESEEGRLASERCLKSLKEYVSASPASQDLLLPPSPARSTRWGLPRLPSLGKRPSIDSLSPLPSPPLELPNPSSNLTAFKSNAITRRVSTNSMSSTSTYNPQQSFVTREKALPTPINTNSPSFGSFSFSSLIAPRTTSPLAESEEISPRMKKLDSLIPDDEEVQRRRSSGMRSNATLEESESDFDGEELDGRSLESMISDSTSSEESTSRPCSPGGGSEDIVVWEDISLAGRGDTNQVQEKNSRASLSNSLRAY